MIKNTWVNLPVKSLSDSVEFFEKLEFKFNKQFNATNMLLNDNTMVLFILGRILTILMNKNWM